MTHGETLAASQLGDDDHAERLARADLHDATTSGDAAAEVDSHCMLARVALRRGDLHEVKERALEAAEVATGSGDARLERIPIDMLAVEARMSGRLAEARELYLKSIALNDRLGEARMAAAEHRNLAYVELHDGHLELDREMETFGATGVVPDPDDETEIARLRKKLRADEDVDPLAATLDGGRQLP